MSTLRVYEDVEQRSDHWYELRRGIVTASTVGKLLTPTLKVADNDTSRGVTASLVAERITGVVEPTSVTPDMWRGIEHEPFAREKYAKHYGEVVECGFMVRESESWKVGLSPDGLVGDDGLIEIKCPRAKGHLQTILSGQVPAVHMAQLQCGLFVSGRKWVDYVSFFGGMPLWRRRVLPDPAWAEAIVAAVEKFELAAREMEAAYREAAVNLPATERVDLEVVI